MRARAARASVPVVDANPLPANRREDLQRNVVLIRELNLNIGKVVELYRELSVRCGGSPYAGSNRRVCGRHNLGRDRSADSSGSIRLLRR